MELKADKKVIVERNNKVVYDNGDTVVKVLSGSKPSADIMNQALNLTSAEQAGINVPSLVEISKVGNCWAVSTRKVAGKTIRQLIEEHPEKEDEYLNKFVDIELAIHAHKAPLLTRQKDKFTRMINSIPDILDEATRYELLLKLDGMKPHTKVCHGDFVPSIPNPTRTGYTVAGGDLNEDGLAGGGGTVIIQSPRQFVVRRSKIKH